MRTRLPTLGPRGEGWVLIQAALIVAEVAAGTAGAAWEGSLRVAGNAAGVAGLVAGGTLAVSGARALGRGLTPLPRPGEGARLIQSGAFRLVRHPIYGGLVVAALGWGLLTASLPALAGALVMLVFFDLKSRREEAWIEEQFDGYAAYRARTRRLIPWLY